MSILGTIMSSILGGRAQPAPPPAAKAAGMSPPDSAPGSTQAQPHASAPTVAPTPPHAKHPSPQAQPPAHAGTPPSAAPPGQVDVAAVLDKRAQEAGQELNWRTSIVDLMKLLKLDSSLAARKTLAKELNYTGGTKDSAAMNMWLHKQVMARLVEGGGKLPSDVMH